MRTVRMHPRLIGSLVVVTALVVAAIVWWLTPSEPLSAQEQMEDACADPLLSNEYDATVHTFGPNGKLDGRLVLAIDEAVGMHVRAYGPVGAAGSGDTLRYENYTIFPTASSSTGNRFTSAGVNRVYVRHMEGGQWGAWKASNQSFEPNDAVAERFCGYNSVIFDDFQYNGVETVNGTSTKKFTGTIDTVTGVFDTRVEFWVDPDGRLAKKAITHTNSNTRWEVTYSGWGESNAIAAPVVQPRHYPFR